jgi:hypothetical protein
MRHFEQCQVEREIERKSYTLDPLADPNLVERISKVIVLCGAPLFGEDMTTGVCPNCRKGFESPSCHITEKGWKLIRRVIGDAQWSEFVRGKPQGR